MTVLEVIQRGTEFLSKKGVSSPRLQAELLVAHLLKVPRLNLYLDFSRSLTETEAGQLRSLIKERGARKPLQHILGSSSFCGFEFSVNRDVLIPRPETELLAEKAWQFLWADRSRGAILDFGTGSGCLAVTLALKVPSARCYALDLEEAALAVARKNAERHGVSDRIEFLRSDGFAAVPGDLKFDLILSNPPYIPSAQIERLEPEVRDHDPRPALDGGPDGLLFYRKLAREGGTFLRPGGRLMAELGDEQQPPVAQLFEQSNWVVESVETDYHGVPRILMARKAG